MQRLTDLIAAIELLEIGYWQRKTLPLRKISRILLSWIILLKHPIRAAANDALEATEKRFI